MSLTALQSTKKPWVHLLIMQNGRQLDLAQNVPANFVVKIVSGVKCKTKSGLLAEFARALSFPDYFGHNWDALEECLADLDWLPARGYIIVVTEAEQVLTKLDDEDDYETFIEILSEAGEAWSSKRSGAIAGEGTPFHTVLTVSEKYKHKRKNWLVPPLAIDHTLGDVKRSGPSKLKAR
jgi:RNAse (barnase) inhibitor barstar